MKKFLLLLIICFAVTSCKDTDKDGVYDRNDGCPETYGLEEFNGCPDSDGDGIQNSEDDCPDDYGLEEFNGCPDTDEDGVQDSEDDCPEEFGLEEFAGCPDTDEDGVPDHEDDCPETFGYEKYDGCPDRNMMKLLASDCFKSANMTIEEISECTEKYQTQNNTIITYEHCEIIYDYIVKVRELQSSMNSLQKQIDGGYIYAVHKTNHGQYLIVKKNNWYYLMNIVSGGPCTMGTMKFNEDSYSLQDVWVRQSPYEEKYKGFQMIIIDKNRDYANLEIKMRKMGY